MRTNKDIGTGIDRLFRISPCFCSRQFHVFRSKVHKGNGDFGCGFRFPNHFYPIPVRIQKVHQIRSIRRKFLSVQAVGKIHKRKTNTFLVESENRILPSLGLMNSQSLCRFTRPKIDRVIDCGSATVHRVICRMGHNVKARFDFRKADFFRRTKARVRCVAFRTRNKDCFLIHNRNVCSLDILFPRSKDVIVIALRRIFLARFK